MFFHKNQVYNEFLKSTMYYLPVKSWRQGATALSAGKYVARLLHLSH